jgi:hypothetical protein
VDRFLRFPGSHYRSFNYGGHERSGDFQRSPRPKWFGALGLIQFVTTFNADGTFTAVITCPSGVIATDSGTWLFTAPDAVPPCGNPQGHLTFTSTQGVVLFSDDILPINVDPFTTLTTGTGSLGAFERCRQTDALKSETVA